MITMQSTRNYRSCQLAPAPTLSRPSGAPDSPVTTVRRSLAPIALLTFEASAVSSLHRLGSVAFLRLPALDASAWREWIRLGNPADVLAALARVAALGAAWWLLVSTILYLAARLHRSARGIRLASRVAPAVVRRFVDGVVVVSVAGVLAGGRTGVARAVGSPQPPAGGNAAPAASLPDAPLDRGVVLRADVGRGIVYPFASPGAEPAAPAGPPGSPRAASPSSGIPSMHRQVVPGGTLAPDALLTAPPPLALPPSPSEAAGEPPTAAGGQQAQEPPGASSPPGVPYSAGDAREGSAVWAVQPGESLWTMAARGIGAERSDARRVGPYWLQVVAANRGSIASGDPDLVLPGEAIVMPPPASPGSEGR